MVIHMERWETAASNGNAISPYCMFLMCETNSPQICFHEFSQNSLITTSTLLHN